MGLSDAYWRLQLQDALGVAVRLNAHRASDPKHPCSRWALHCQRMRLLFLSLAHRSPLSGLESPGANGSAAFRLCAAVPHQNLMIRVSELSRLE